MPKFSVKAIVDIQYQLLKYRGLQPSNQMSALQFFQLNNLLNKDIIDNEIDPFPRRGASGKPE